MHIFDATSCKLIAASPLPFSYLSMTQKTTKSPTATFYTPYVNTTKKKRGLLAHTQVVEANKQKHSINGQEETVLLKKKASARRGGTTWIFQFRRARK